MAGFFQRCGAHSCPPHSWTKDERTVISYENAHLKKKLETLFSMKKEKQYFDQKGSLEDFASFFSGWLQTQITTAAGIGKKFMVIKHPLTIFALKKIQPFLSNPSYIVLKRPLGDIEASRLRRSWDPLYGKEGAEIIYNKVTEVTSQLCLRTFEIGYDEFRSNKDKHKQLINFCELKVDPVKLTEASAWIR